ncbi:sugar phosphate nucleotidyltransferase [Pelagibacteraceae bacterium]|nr:sugar phosphate nucleotidyltransferase [Pelagibacteraceae bacterium]
MKIRPIILCGGAGTRLWPQNKENLPKQFIDFGGWNLFKKTLERIKNPVFDHPIISTNLKYLKDVKKNLKECNIKKYIIILEPLKKNTAPAILSSTLIDEVPINQPLIFLAADQLIEKNNIFIKSINNHKTLLDSENIFIFGIKPTNPSSDYGYFVTKKKDKNINKVTRFIEKPNIKKAKSIIKRKGYWNSGMLLLRKDSIINNFKKFQPLIYKNCLKSVIKSEKKNNIYTLNKKFYAQTKEKSFDYAILEKSKKINAIKLDIPWSDLGSWKEICKMYDRNKNKYFKKSNIFYRPWGKYTNLFEGKGFLMKEINVKSKGLLSLQKHLHRSEHWLITQGIAKVTLNKKVYLKKKNETIFIPLGSIHRIQNNYKTTLKIIEAQVGSLLKETDIIRFQDIYGRVK